MILEAPGGEEIKTGVPICGASGVLIDKSVPEDFDFDDAYIINAMQCRPPSYNGDTIRQKEYKIKACKACASRVAKQVWAHPRKCILAMGAWSNAVITGDYSFKITARRGVPYPIANPETGEQVVIMPAVHPAFLLRGSGNPKEFQKDVAIAVALAFDQEITVRNFMWADPEYKTLATLADFKTYVKGLEWRATGWPWGPLEVAADIETTGLKPKIDTIRSIGFYRHDAGAGDCSGIIPKEALTDKVYYAAIRAFLLDPRFSFIWQNGKFDKSFLQEVGLLQPEECVIGEDTLLESYSLSEATRDHDLDEQAKNRLGIPAHKAEAIKRYKNADDYYRNAPDAELFDYQSKDLKKTFFLHEYLRPQIDVDSHLTRLYHWTLLPASNLLTEIEMYGIHVDWDYVRINRKGAQPEDRERGLVPVLFHHVTGEELPEIGIEDLKLQCEQQIHTLAGWGCNPNSPDEVKTLLYEQYGLRIKGKKPDDTRKETLAKLPNHPAVELIRKYRSLTKILGTYIVAIEREAINDRVHTNFKLHASTTGRLSSSEPNIQNIPRDPRWKRMYRARPGYVFVEGDYNSAELRMLAALSGDEFLMGVFLDDRRNLHDEVSVAMYGPHFDADQRIRAKAINFGIPYGREAYSVSVEFDMPLKEAQRLIDAWFARAPGAAKFLKVQAQAASTGKTLVTVFGRKRRPGVVSYERVHSLQNEFRNFHMQSPITDFTLHAGMRMLPRLKKEGAHIVNLVHDSSVTECPGDSKDRIQQVAGIVKETMEAIPKEWIVTPIQFKVDIKLGTHWGLCIKPEKFLNTFRPMKLAA
jgi:uracil-DNA glycosylase family 4